LPKVRNIKGFLIFTFADLTLIVVL